MAPEHPNLASTLNAKGEMRRLKAAIALGLIYGVVGVLHLTAAGVLVVWGIVLVMAIHAVRLLMPKSHLINVPPMDEQLPLISLVVAAKNEETVIANLVQGLCQITYRADHLELWIVDDNSSDQTSLILEKLETQYPQLRVLHRGADAKGGKSGALNQVLPLTRGEIIGVFDADAQVPPNILDALVPRFNDPKIGAVQLRKAIANRATNFWTKGQAAEMALDIFFQERRKEIHGIGELRGNGQFVRRSALERCGGWNEQTITDDLDLTLRLHLDGWDIDCLVHPAVSEEGVVTLKQLWHQRNRWAEGGYQRYLDYWSLILKNKMGLPKTFDLGIFLLLQYVLPTAIIPDLVLAIALDKRPMLSPIMAVTTILSTLGMALGIRQSDHPPLMATLGQTLRGTIYMLHWIPVMVSVTLRMAIRPKQLKWVKTVHQGLGETLDNELKPNH